MQNVFTVRPHAISLTIVVAVFIAVFLNGVSARAQAFNKLRPEQIECSGRLGGIHLAIDGPRRIAQLYWKSGPELKVSMASYTAGMFECSTNEITLDSVNSILRMPSFDSDKSGLYVGNMGSVYHVDTSGSWTEIPVIVDTLDKEIRSLNLLPNGDILLTMTAYKWTQRGDSQPYPGTWYQKWFGFKVGVLSDGVFRELYTTREYSTTTKPIYASNGVIYIGVPYTEAYKSRLLEIRLNGDYRYIATPAMLTRDGNIGALVEVDGQYIRAFYPSFQNSQSSMHEISYDHIADRIGALHIWPHTSVRATNSSWSFGMESFVSTTAGFYHLYGPTGAQPYDLGAEVKSMIPTGPRQWLASTTSAMYEVDFRDVSSIQEHGDNHETQNLVFETGDIDVCDVLGVDTADWHVFDLTGNMIENSNGTKKTFRALPGTFLLQSGNQRRLIVVLGR